MSSVVRKVLPLATALLFLGRAYGYFWWGGPLRTLAWDEALLRPLVEGGFGRSWTAYATDGRVDAGLNLLTRGIALLWLACVPAALMLRRRRDRSRRAAAVVLGAGTVGLALHALLETRAHFNHLAQLGEHAIQVGVPVLLLGWSSGRLGRRGLLVGLRVVTAVTFAAHGLYALGVYPVPAHFVGMTMDILGVGEAAARQLLAAAGWLDLAVAAGIWWPGPDRYLLAYAALWGLLTALARTVAGFDPEAVGPSLHGYLYQTVYRLPHGLVPLLALRLAQPRSTPHPRAAPER